MKADDLKSPFTWELRHVLIQDRIWYVPDYYDKYVDFVFPGWNHVDLFGNNHPIKVEYCSGNGSWIIAKAEENPLINWVAVEKQFFRARKIWAKIKTLQLKNIIVICGEAWISTHHYFPTDSIDEVFINFPDPWPKARHAKHRLIQPRFIEEIWRVLKQERNWTFVTDDFHYSTLLLEEMHAFKNFVSSYPDPFYTTTYQGYGKSYFEDLWRGKGRLIRYHQFYKKD